jgi:hypothetical protein
MAQLFGSCPQPTLLRKHSGWLAMQSLLRFGRKLPAFVDGFNKAIVWLLHLDLEAAPGVWVTVGQRDRMGMVQRQ